MTNKKNKEKSITIRLSKELYEKVLFKAIEETNSKKELVGISELIRELIEKNY